MAPTGKLFRAATSRRLATNPKYKSSLPNKQCLAIVKKLRGVYLSGQPCKLQELVKRLEEGLLAQITIRLEPEKATAILWKVLHETNAGLRKVAEDAQAILDGADGERENRLAAAAAAEAKCALLRHEMAEGSAAVKDAVKVIESRKAAIVTKRAMRQSQESEVKKVQIRKRHLELVEQESYEPLRRGPADGQEGHRHLEVLRRTGKAYGFHKELLSVAPVILRKQLVARHTFDALIVDQLDNEFSKHVSSLEANGIDAKRAVIELTQDVRQAEQDLMEANAVHGQAALRLSAAAAAAAEGQQALVQAKTCVRRLPADLKRAERSAQKMEARFLKFQRGPRATFEKALGLEFGAVGSMAAAGANGVGGASTDIISTCVKMERH